MGGHYTSFVRCPDRYDSKKSEVGEWSCYVEISTLLHSERPKLYAILAFLSAIGLRLMSPSQLFSTILQEETTFLTSCVLP